MTSTESQDDFERVLETLQNEDDLAEKKGESDAEIVKALLDSIYKRERARHRVDENPESWANVDAITLEKMKNWDTSDYRLVNVEKALRQLATGNGDAAIKMLRDAIDGRTKAFSEQQSVKAKMPRKIHPIQALIDEIVDSNPGISENKLKYQLKREVGRGIIDSFSDGAYTPVDQSFPPLKKSSLRNRLHRAKKKSQ
jgi:hypothetical protein